VTAIAVGVDAGSYTSGVTVLAISGTRLNPIATFVWTGEVESTGPAFDAFFARCLPFQQAASKFVAVEKTQGVAYGAKGAGIVPHLISCARADAMICENARHLGVLVVELTAVEWRKQVCGRPNAKDSQVKTAIAQLVRNWPRVSNPHHRDAAGVALAASWRTR
jgi:Holliday junction resolvasome RuvABC endonuclease subunit